VNKTLHNAARLFISLNARSLRGEATDALFSSKDNPNAASFVEMKGILRRHHREVFPPRSSGPN
jgi:hypothetical protein